MICSELKIFESAQQPALEVHYDAREQTLRRKDGCGEYLHVSWDHLETESKIDLFICIPCKPNDELKWIVTTDGSIVNKKRPDLAVGVSGTNLILVQKEDDVRRASFKVI